MTRPILASIALLVLCGSALSQQDTVPKPDPQSAAEKYFTDVVLVDQSGENKRFYTDLLKGHVVVISSFLSTCKSACPVANKNLQAIQDAVGDKLGKSVYLISITVDPLTDTPERLRAYADQSHAKAGWYFLTGEKTNVDFALNKVGLYVENKEEHRTILIIGNEPSGLWKKAVSTASREEIIKIVESVINDPGLQPSTGPGKGVAAPGHQPPTSTTEPQTTDGERIYSMSTVDQKPVILSKPKAGYTEEARRNKTQGVVILRMVLSAKGTVERVTVVRGLPDGLDEKSIEAARQIKFRPGVKDGKPVSVSILVEYGFDIY